MARPALSVLRRPPLAAVAALAVLAVLAIPIGALLAQPAGATYTVVETGQGYARLQQAVDAIGSGRGTIAIAAGRHADCAVQSQGSIAYVAAEPGMAVFVGTTCEG